MMYYTCYNSGLISVVIWRIRLSKIIMYDIAYGYVHTLHIGIILYLFDVLTCLLLIILNHIDIVVYIVAI